MHPAYSVVFFTCASGAGYGLLTWIASLIVNNRLGPESWLWPAGLALSFVLISAGLLSSTAHLGRPERAWRAFSQWRTSWLSREGIAAVLTFVPIIVLGYLWLDPDALGLQERQIVAALAMIGAITTVWCTGMIYASLKTIRAWTDPVVAPLYVVLSLASGALLLLLLLTFAGRPLGYLPWVAMSLLLLAWLMKGLYWSAIDGAARTHTIEAATGLGPMGKVRQLEPPHTGANYVMREMGYEVARRHRDQLRRFAVVLAFLVPVAILLLIRLVTLPLWPAWLLVATLSCLLGLLVERWLFFAEAEHVSMLYYGREKA